MDLCIFSKVLDHYITSRLPNLLIAKVFLCIGDKCFNLKEKKKNGKEKKEGEGCVAISCFLFLYLLCGEFFGSVFQTITSEFSTRSRMKGTTVPSVREAKRSHETTTLGCRRLLTLLLNNVSVEIWIEYALSSIIFQVKGHFKADDFSSYLSLFLFSFSHRHIRTLTQALSLTQVHPPPPHRNTRTHSHRHTHTGTHTEHTHTHIGTHTLTQTHTIIHRNTQWHPSSTRWHMQIDKKTYFPEFVSYADCFKEMECGLFIFMSLTILGRNGKDWQRLKECLAT